MAAATFPRSDIQVIGDDQRLYSELDDEFYGFCSEDVETLSTASTELIEESDEEDISTCSGRVRKLRLSTEFKQHVKSAQDERRALPCYYETS